MRLNRRAYGAVGNGVAGRYGRGQRRVRALHGGTSPVRRQSGLRCVTRREIFIRRGGAERDGMSGQNRANRTEACAAEGYNINIEEKSYDMRSASGTDTASAAVFAPAEDILCAEPDISRTAAEAQDAVPEVPAESGAEDTDERYMREAFAEARAAAALGEVPVGAVIVRDGEIIARAGNRRESAKLATAHAELLAIEEACRTLGGWRLPRCTLYVTLEPCPMCAGAIVNSRIERVVFGAADPKAGAFSGVFDLNSFPLNHHPEIVPGVLGAECGALLSEFFAMRRVSKKI